MTGGRSRRQAGRGRTGGSAHGGKSGRSVGAARPATPGRSAKGAGRNAYGADDGSQAAARAEAAALARRPKSRIPHRYRDSGDGAESCVHCGLKAWEDVHG